MTPAPEQFRAVGFTANAVNYPLSPAGRAIMVAFLQNEARAYAAKLTPHTGCAARDDGYVPLKPEETMFWKAADYIASLEPQAGVVEALREALERIVERVESGLTVDVTLIIAAKNTLAKVSALSQQGLDHLARHAVTPSEQGSVVRTGYFDALDGVMHFINALDSSDMDGRQVRSAIYSYCLEARPDPSGSVVRLREALETIRDLDPLLPTKGAPTDPDYGLRAVKQIAHDALSIGGFER